MHLLEEPRQRAAQKEEEKLVDQLRSDLEISHIKGQAGPGCSFGRLHE